MRISLPHVSIKAALSRPAPSRARNTAKSSWLFAAKVVLGGLLFGLVLWQANLGHVSKVLFAANVGDAAWAVAFLCGGVLVNSHRWYVVASAIGQPITLRTSVIGYSESMFFNQVLPTSVGGDASRVLRAIDAGLLYGWAIISVLIDRAFGLWIVAFCVVGAYLVGSSPIIASPAFLAICATSAMILVGSVVAAIVGAFVGSEDVPVWAAAFIMLAKSFYACVTTPAAIFIGIDMLLTTLLSVASFHMCALAIHIPLGWWDATIILQGVVLASVLPASIGGWGLREGASVVLFAPLGIGAADATAVSILFGLAITVLGLMGAIVWICAGYRRRIRLSSRQSAQP